MVASQMPTYLRLQAKPAVQSTRVNAAAGVIHSATAVALSSMAGGACSPRRSNLMLCVYGASAPVRHLL